MWQRGRSAVGEYEGAEAPDITTAPAPPRLLQGALARLPLRDRAWAAATWDDRAAEQPIRQRFVLTITRGGWQASQT